MHLDIWRKFKTHLRYNISYSYKRRAFNRHILDRQEHAMLAIFHTPVEFETAVAHGISGDSVPDKEGFSVFGGI